MLLHWMVIPPRRDNPSIPPTYQAYEFERPNQPIPMRETALQIQNTLTFTQLRHLMQEYRLKIPEQPTRPQVEAEMRRVLIHARTYGLVGLERAGSFRGYKGGGVRSFRATSSDLVEYLTLLKEFYVRRHLNPGPTAQSGPLHGIEEIPGSGLHPSSFVENPQVHERRLVQAKWRSQRNWTTAKHHVKVLTRSRGTCIWHCMATSSCSIAKQAECRNSIQPCSQRIVHVVSSTGCWIVGRARQQCFRWR